MSNAFAEGIDSRIRLSKARGYGQALTAVMYRCLGGI
jgi:hypothetical protein